MSENAARRLLWIDFLRGLAVLGMIEAHVVQAFLASAERTGWSFERLNIFNGWVAPIFLFLAGLLQGRWVRKNWDCPLPLAPRLRYLGLIWLVGYALQTHWEALGDANLWLHALSRVDVLHCLAASLILLLILSRIAYWRLPLSSYETLVAALGILAVLLTPHVWSVLAQRNWPAPIAGYFSPAQGAIFPLFPWFGYIAAGVLASRWLERPTQYWWGFAGCLLLVPLAEKWPVATELGAVPQPELFLSRLAAVFALCFIAGKFASIFNAPFFKPILWTGRHSLLFYAVHLIILYGGMGMRPLANWFPRSQTTPTVWALFFLTLAVTAGVSWLVLCLWRWTCQQRGLPLKN